MTFIEQDIKGFLKLGNKAQLMTNHPRDSYEIVDNDGVKTLHISNPHRFWEKSNFLVIKID